MPKVRFLNELVTADVPQNATLRDVAIEQCVEIYRGMWPHINCGGRGVCGRCKVWIASSNGDVSAPSLRERFHRARGKMRLACQVRIQGDLEVRTRPIGPALVDLAARAGASPPYREKAEARLREALDEESKASEAAKKKAAEEATAAEAAKEQADEAGGDQSTSPALKGSGAAGAVEPAAAEQVAPAPAASACSPGASAQAAAKSSGEVAEDGA